MLNMLNVLLILFTLIKEILLQNPWTVTYYLIEKEGETIDTLIVKKGSYAEIYLQFTPASSDANDFHRITGKLEIEGTTIKLAEDYFIDTYKDRRVKVLIGFHCSAPIDTIPSSLHFMISAFQSTVKFPKLNIQISNELNVIEIKPLANVIPSPSYAYYEVLGKLYNVDELRISFTQMNDAQIDPLTIAPYQSNRLPKFNKAKYIVNIKTQQTFDFTIDTSNSCYSFKNPQVSFTANTNDPIPSEDLTSVATFSLKESPSLEVKNVIELDIKTSKTPVIVSCGSFPSAEYKPQNDQEIRQPTKLSPNFQYAQVILNDADLFQTLTFKDVNRVSKGYIIRCILEGTSTKETAFTPIEISKKKESYSPISIILSYPSVSQCGSWTFQSNNNINFFTSKAKEYCERNVANYYYKQSLNNLDENGCIQCDTITYSEKPNQVDICIRSLFNCKTDFKDIKNFHIDFIESLNSTAKLEQILGIQGMSEVNSAIQLSDDDKFGMSSFNIQYPYADSTKQTIQVTNRLNRDISCMTFSILSTSIKNGMEKVNEMDKSIGIIKSGKTVSVDLEVERKITNQFMYIYFRCRNLINYPQGQYYESNPILVKPVLDTDITIKEFPDAPKKSEKECENNYFSECYPNKEQTIDTSIKLPSLSDLNYDIMDSTLGTSNVLLQGELRILNTLTDKKNVTKQIIHIGRVMFLVVCTRSNNYNECRKFKTSYMKELLKITQRQFTCSNIINDIKNIDQTSLEDSATNFVLAIWHMASNGECFDMENGALLSNISHCFITQLPSFIKEITTSEEGIVKGKIILQALFGYLSYSSFFNVHFDIEKILNVDDYGIIYDKHIMQYKQDMDILIAQYAKMYDEEFSCNSIIVDFRRVTQSEDPIIFDLSQYNIKTKLTIPKSCLTEIGADMVIFVLNNRYPLVSVFTTQEFLHRYVYSVRFFKTNEDKDINITKPFTKPMTLTFAYEKPNGDTVKHDYYKLYQFEKDFKEFVFESLQKSVIDNVTGTVTLDKDGDFVIGSNDGSIPWMIAMFSIVSAILLAGLGYFIYANIKKRRNNNMSQIESVSPLL